MPKPSGIGMIDIDRLNISLGAAWPHGEISAVESRRIGEAYGFAGEVWRLSVETPDGQQTLIAKKETPEQVERVVSAYQLMAESLQSSVPILYGTGPGLTLFEDVSPATQGDGLAVRSEWVRPMLELLARLHASTWSAGPSGWLPEHWDRKRWDDRLSLARDRYPDEMDDGLFVRLTRLHTEMPSAIETLRTDPRALIHMDCGYDNTLWRPDGSAVLLDWSNALIGPPGYDIATHLIESDPDEALTAYHDELQVAGVDMSPTDLRKQAAAGLRLKIRGMVGFVGLPSQPPRPRLRHFRDEALARIRAELAWLDRS